VDSARVVGEISKLEQVVLRLMVILLPKPFGALEEQEG
jgi:hypothetical protein